MTAHWVLLVAGLALAALVHADTSCPNAQPFAGCVVAPGWKLANLTGVLTSAKKPPLITVPALTVLDYPGRPNLLSILPLNGAVDLLLRSIPQDTHNCFLPLYRGYTVKGWANNPKAPYHDLVKACVGAPWPDSAENSFVVGAFGDLATVPAKRLVKVPDVNWYKRRYNKLAPHLGLCVGVNPCNMNIFIGLQKVKHYTNFVYSYGGAGQLNVVVRPDSFFYSFGVSMQPPAWRAPGSTPLAWGIDPSVNGSLGYNAKVEKLCGTTVTGSVYVEGPLSGSQAPNVLNLSSVLMVMGPQTQWWGLLRDASKPAVSMQLTAMPNIVLWGRISLPFRNFDKYIQIRDVQLTARPSDAFFWASAYAQSIPAFQLARNIAPIGNLLAKVYQGAKTGTSHRISSFEMHGHGAAGAAIRLQFSPGKITLTPAAQKVVGISQIFTGWGAIFRAAKDAKSLLNVVTLDLAGKPYQIVFCSSHQDCFTPARCWTHCHDTLRVCMPRRPAPGGCIGTLPFDVTAAAAAAASASETPASPAVTSPAPL